MVINWTRSEVHRDHEVLPKNWDVNYIFYSNKSLEFRIIRWYRPISGFSITFYFNITNYVFTFDYIVLLLLLVSPDEAMCPPDFSTHLVDTTVNDGQPLELSCKVIGDPEPQVTWLKNSKVNAKFNKFTFIVRTRSYN